MTQADPAFEQRDPLAAAKEAFDSGNELAALDAWFICRRRKIEIPAWVATAMPIDPDTARHRRKKTGRHAKARRFTEEQIEHVERYHAVVFAKTQLREPWRTAYRAAAIWLRADSQKAVRRLTIVRSYKMVKRAKDRKRMAKFWVPASHEVLSLFRDRDHQGWVSCPRKMD